ncbi:hypothetical protein GOV11_03965 [Candidatus Woesearchaeota archaeon]|nr:hypothetical protein [Candidatus Woesearchaeota archaeon]
MSRITHRGKEEELPYSFADMMTDPTAKFVLWIHDKPRNELEEYSMEEFGRTPHFPFAVNYGTGPTTLRSLRPFFMTEESFLTRKEYDGDIYLLDFTLEDKIFRHTSNYSRALWSEIDKISRSYDLHLDRGYSELFDELTTSGYEIDYALNRLPTLDMHDRHPRLQEYLKNHSE